MARDADLDEFNRLLDEADDPPQEPAHYNDIRDVMSEDALRTFGLSRSTRDLIEETVGARRRQEEAADIRSSLDIATRESEERTAKPGHKGIFGESWGLLDEEGQQQWVKDRRTSVEADKRTAQDVAERTKRGEAFFYDRAAPESGMRQAIDAGREETRETGAELIKGADDELKKQREIELGKRPAATLTPTRSRVEGFATGLAGIPTGIAKGVAIGASYIGQLGGLDTDPDQNTVVALTRFIDAKAKEIFPGDPQRQEEFGQKLAEGAGSVIGFYGTPAAGRLVGLSNKALVTIAALTGSTVEGASTWEEAVRAGKKEGLEVDERAKFLAFAGGLVLGTTEAAPIGHWLNRAPGGSRVRAAFTQMLEEGGQEAFQTFGENALRRWLYDPNQSYGEGVVDAFGVGGTLGFGLGFVGPRQRRQRGPEVTTTTPPQTDLTRPAVPGAAPVDTRTIAASQPGGPERLTPGQGQVRGRRQPDPIAESVETLLGEIEAEAQGRPASPDRQQAPATEASAAVSIREAATPAETGSPRTEGTPPTASSPERIVQGIAEALSGKPAVQESDETLTQGAQNGEVANQIDDAARSRFSEVLSSRERRSNWGKAAGLNEEQVRTLVQEAVADGRLTLRKGEPVRTAKARQSPATPEAELARAAVSVPMGRAAEVRLERITNNVAYKHAAAILGAGRNREAALKQLAADRKATRAVLDEIHQAVTGKPSKSLRTKQAVIDALAKADEAAPAVSKSQDVTSSEAPAAEVATSEDSSQVRAEPKLSLPPGDSYAIRSIQSIEDPVAAEHARSLIDSGTNVEAAIGNMLADRRVSEEERAQIAEAYTGYPLAGDPAHAIREAAIRRGEEIRAAVLGHFEPEASPSNLRVRNDLKIDDISARLERMARRLPAGVELQIKRAMRHYDPAMGQVRQLEGGVSYEAFKKILAVSLEYGPDVAIGTFTHEEIHLLKELGYLSSKEWKTLEGVALRRPKSAEAIRILDTMLASKKIDQARYDDLNVKAGKLTYRELYAVDARYPHLRGNEALLVEETVAHAAADWSNGREFHSAIERVFQKIRDLLEAIQNAMNGLGFRSANDVFESIWSGELTRKFEESQERYEAAAERGREMMREDGLIAMAIRAFHGSPHRFDRFTMEAIGSGEGAQAFGHGLYFAESEKIALHYRDALAGKGGIAYEVDGDEFKIKNSYDYEGAKKAGAEIAQKHGLSEADGEAIGVALFRHSPGQSLAESLKQMKDAGRVDLLPAESADRLIAWAEQVSSSPPSDRHLYEVRIDAEPEQFLDWDKPLGEQSQAVIDAVRSAYPEWLTAVQPFETMLGRPGKDAYFAAHRSTGSNAGVDASRALRDAGLAGIRYLDASSRRAGDGTRNVVVFDDSLVTITSRDGRRIEPDGGQAMFAFAGESAATADQEALSKAEEMEFSGATRESIWHETGWFRGVDERWRFEIDDSKSKVRVLSPKYSTLARELTHADLFDAYPELEDVQFMMTPGGNFAGSFYPETEMSPALMEISRLAPKKRSVVLHETQHGIQEIEGFAIGGDAEQFSPLEIAAEMALSDDMSSAAAKDSLYRKLAGEVESRAVQKRMNMTADQREDRPPWLDYDVPEDEQLVRFGDGEPSRMASIDASTGRSMRSDLDALGYYSQALRAAQSWPQKKGSPDQVIAHLKKSGVKDAEIEATGLRGFLEGKSAVTREEVVSHLEGNRVGLTEVSKGRKNEDDPRTGDEQIDGLRDELDRLEDEGRAYDAADNPTPEYRRALDELHELEQRQVEEGTTGDTDYHGWSLDPENPTYRETVLHLPEERYGDLGVQGHFGEPNVIGHMMTSLTLKGDARVFTIDQIQSDWGQRIRDKGARADGAMERIASERATVKAEYEKALDLVNDMLPLEDQLRIGQYEIQDAIWLAESLRDTASGQSKLSWRRLLPGAASRREQALAAADALERAANEMARIQGEQRAMHGRAPPHPFVNTTDQWVNTTLRRALRQAIEAEVDYIAIPTGDTVLSYNPGDKDGMRGFYGSKAASPDDLSAARSELAQRQREHLGEPGSLEQVPYDGDAYERMHNAQMNVRSLEGRGETQIGIVPKNLRNLLSKIDKASPAPQYVETLDSPSGKTNLGKGFTLFELTDKVKSSVLSEGQPMFAFGPDNSKRAGGERISAFHGTNARFNRFDLSKTNEAGFHFGTEPQANARRESHGATGWFSRWRNIPVDIDASRILDLKGDPGWFGGTALARQLHKDGFMPQEVVAEVRKLEAKNLDGANKLIRDWIIGQGYDLVRYPNRVEGGGDYSYMALGTGNVRNAETGDVMFAFGPTPPQSTPEGESPGLNKIISDLKKSLGMTVSQGLWGMTVRQGARSLRIRPPSNVRGQYDRESGNISIRESRDIKTIAHEGGHHLEMVLGNDLASLKQQHAAELAGTATPTAAQLSEAFADWFRSYVLDRAAAQKQAPNLTAAFRDLLEAEQPDLLIGLDTIEEEYARYVKSGPLEQVTSSIVSVEDNTLFSQLREDEFFDNVSGWISTAYTNVVDALHPLQLGVQYLLKTADANGIVDADGRPISLKAADDPYKRMRMFAGSYARAKMWLMNGVSDLRTGAITSPSLREAVEMALSGSRWNRKTIRRFNQYLVSKRAVEEYKLLEQKDLDLARVDSLIERIDNARPTVAAKLARDLVTLDSREDALTRASARRSDRRRGLSTTQNQLAGIQARMDQLRADIAEADDVFGLARDINDPTATDAAQEQYMNLRARRVRSLQFLERDQRRVLREVDEQQQAFDEIDVEVTMLETEIGQLRDATSSGRERVAQLDDMHRQVRRDREVTQQRGASRAPTLEPKEVHERVLREYGTPEFQEAARLVHEFAFGLLRTRHQAGFITDEQFEALAKRKDWYVPFYRDMSDIEGAKGMFPATGSKRWAKLKKFNGSDRSIMAPLEILSQEAYSTAMQIAFNDVVKSLVNLAERVGPGGGAIAERLLRTDELDPGKEAFARIRDLAISLGIDPLDAHLIVQRAEMNFSDNDTIKLIMSPENLGPQAKFSLPLWENGERVMVRIPNPDFAKAMFEAIDAIGHEMQDVFVGFFGNTARALRVGVTTALDFIGANFYRDVWSAWKVTGVAPLYGHYLGAKIMLGVGDVAGIPAKDFQRLYNEAGGIAGGANVNAETARQQRDIQDLVGTRVNWKSVAGGAAVGGAFGAGVVGILGGAAGFLVAGPVGGVAGAALAQSAGFATGAAIGASKGRHGEVFKMVESVETAARIGVAAHAYKRAILWDPTLTQGEAIFHAAMDARDYLDWNRRGSKMLVVARGIPFLLSYINGLMKNLQQGVAYGARGSGVRKQIDQSIQSVLQRRMGVVWKHQIGDVLSKQEEAELAEAYMSYARLAGYTMILLGLIAAGSMTGGDDYDDIKDSAQSREDYIKINGTWIRLPGSFELGAPAKAIWIIADRLRGRDDRTFERLGTVAYELLAPPTMQTGTSLVAGVAFNSRKDGWLSTPRPVVSPYLMKLPPQERYDAFTSQLSIDFAQALYQANVPQSMIPAPKKIDFVLTTLGGHWGREAMSTYDNIKTATGMNDRPAKHATDIPVVRRFIGDAARQSRAVDEFWKMTTDAGGEMTIAANGYSNRLDNNDPAGASVWLGRLDQEQRVWALTQKHGSPYEKRQHPLNRLDGVMEGIRDVQHDIVRDTLAPKVRRGRRQVRDFEREIELTPQKKTEVIDILTRLAQIEARNTMILMKRPGFTHMTIKDPKLVTEELEQSSPEVRNHLRGVFDRKKVADWDYLEQQWPDRRRQILERAADAF